MRNIEIGKTSGYALTKFPNPMKSGRVFTPAAAALHTGHAVLHCNSRSSGSILSGGDPRLSGILFSDPRGKGYWYHAVFLSLSASNL
jgi:hypothetical protein